MSPTGLSTTRALSAGVVFTLCGCHIVCMSAPESKVCFSTNKIKSYLYCIFILIIKILKEFFNTFYSDYIRNHSLVRIISVYFYCL